MILKSKQWCKEIVDGSTYLVWDDHHESMITFHYNFVLVGVGTFIQILLYLRGVNGWVLTLFQSIFCRHNQHRHGNVRPVDVQGSIGVRFGVSTCCISQPWSACIWISIIKKLALPKISCLIVVFIILIYCVIAYLVTSYYEADAKWLKNSCDL